MSRFVPLLDLGQASAAPADIARTVPAKASFCPIIAQTSICFPPPSERYSLFKFTAILPRARQNSKRCHRALSKLQGISSSMRDDGWSLCDRKPFVTPCAPLQRTWEATVRASNMTAVPNSPVVDHTRPHRGDPDLFWDEDNLQAMLKEYHDRVKQSIGKRGRH